MAASIANRFSQSYLVLSIPELATLVLTFSNQQACASLAQTCRKIYEISIPFVWAHVDDARNLLRLIDDAIESRAFPSVNKPAKIELPDISRYPNVFSRFSVYASYVKTLDVYGRSGEFYKVQGWNALIARARKQPLLPNLQAITIWTKCSKHGPDQAMWVGAFASPSLTEFCVFLGDEGWNGSISYAAASFILKHMMLHCPNLQKLSLFPNWNHGNYGENGESEYLAFLSGARFYEYIHKLTNLRSVHGSLVWFQDDVILELGRLPHLETLEMNWACDDTGGAADLLSGDSFPSLRNLNLYNIPAIDASNVICFGKALLRNLTSLNVELDLHDLDNYYEDDWEDSEWLNDEFLHFLTDTPNLSTLKLTVNPRNGDCELDELSIKLFSDLPLLFLSLKSIRLATEVLNMDLGIVWPSLTQLEIPSHPAPLDILLRFAAIPSLVHLELRLELHVQSIPDGSIKQTELVNLSASDGSTICSELERVGTVASLLVDTWPNLTAVSWFDTKVDAPQDKARDNENVQVLNSHISALRAT